MTNSEKLLIVIDGFWATGKTTLATHLSNTFGLAMLSKDDFKEILFDQLGVKGRKHSRRLGAASFELLFFSLDKLLEQSQHVVVETMFDPERSAKKIRHIAEIHNARILQVHLTSPFHSRARRNSERIKSGARHRGHWDVYSRFKIWIGANLPQRYLPGPDRTGGMPMDLGGDPIVIETKDFDRTTFEPVIEAVREALGR